MCSTVYNMVLNTGQVVEIERVSGGPTEWDSQLILQQYEREMDKNSIVYLEIFSEILWLCFQ